MTPERQGRRDFVRATGTALAGLHVAPGFIDIHTHSDFDILLYPTADFALPSDVAWTFAGFRSRWTMPFLVRRLEAVGDLPRQIERLAHRQRRTRQAHREVSPGTSFHYQSG